MIRAKRQELLLRKGLSKIMVKLSKEISSNPRDAKKIIHKFVNSPKFIKWAKKLSYDFVKIAETGERKSWKHIRKSKGRRKLALSISEEEMLKLALENFKLIKSVPNTLLKKLETKMGQKIYNQLLGDVGKRDDLYNFLKSKGVKNAKLIARTETAKMNTQITQVRSAKVGCIAYEWGTSNDKRVRQSHKEMNGVVVFWDDKPKLDKMEGHAGEYPNCRCQTLPIIYLEDFLEGKHNIKVYQKGKIKNMRVDEFKKLWISKGGIIE